MKILIKMRFYTAEVLYSRGFIQQRFYTAEEVSRIITEVYHCQLMNIQMMNFPNLMMMVMMMMM